MRCRRDYEPAAPTGFEEVINELEATSNTPTIESPLPQSTVLEEEPLTSPLLENEFVEQLEKMVSPASFGVETPAPPPPLKQEPAFVRPPEKPRFEPPEKPRFEPPEKPRFEPPLRLPPKPEPIVPALHVPQEEPAPQLEPVMEKPKSKVPDYEEVLRIGQAVNIAIQNGNQLAGEGKPDLARREYRTALALNPSSVEAQLGLGFLCFVQGQWDVALEHYIRALEVDPNSAPAHYGIGRVLLETNQTDAAIIEFQSTLALDPTFDEARQTLTALGKAA
jgi:hypothetical protein